MFKKFFKWIKESIINIYNYIDEKKKEEFRHKLDVYYTPDDFYTNPEYKKYYDMYPVKGSLKDNFYKTIHNQNISKIFINTMITFIQIYGAVNHTIPISVNICICAIREVMTKIQEVNNYEYQKMY